MKRKKLLSLLLAVIMVLSVIPVTAISISAANGYLASTGFEGSGTESNPYIVNTASDLFGLFHSDKDMHIKLGQDISVTSTVYIASNITLDMNGKTIKTSSKTSAFDISEGCTFKIKGTGKIDHTGKMYTFFVRGVLETYGNVTYKCPDDLGSVICLSDYGVARIYGGSFSGQQIALNGGGKMYVYGGSITSEVLVTKATQLYVYDGTFENRIYNYGYLYTYGGEFKKDVSSLSESGEATFYGGHFKEGISNYSTSSGGKHILGKNSICMAHNNKDVTDDGLFVRTEITVFRPDFAEQSPEFKAGQTELDAGKINALEDYFVSFKAKDVPKVFADQGYTIEEKLIVKDSDGVTEKYDIKSGTKGQGVKLNLGNLTGDDYTVERTINLYKGPSVVKTNKSTIKITVNPIDKSLFGFATLKPSVSAEDREDRYTDLPETAITTENLTFGFTSFISTKLSDKGFSVKPKMYVNYNNQGTLATFNSGKDINLMNYVNKLGEYQVWFSVSLYNGDEYITSLGHIYNVPIVEEIVPDYNLEVLFTPESKAQAGGFLEADLEKMAENSDEFMQAYLDENVKCQWFLNGSKIDGATDVRFDIPYDYAGKSLYVEVFYGENSLESDNLLIAEGDNDPTETTEITEATEPITEEITTASTEPSTEATEKPTVKTEPTIDTPEKPTDKTEPTTDTPEKPTDKTEPATDTPEKPTDKTEPTTEATENPTNTTEPSVDKGILGDVNGDGKVNVKDATMIQKAAAKIITLTDAENIRANVNGDTKVNVKDATAIQKFAAKIETGYPIGKPIE